MSFSHVTAPTQYVEANGIRFAFRRLGKETGVPLLFLQHFRGGMDHWDPLITDGFAADRAVILFNNAGVASSSDAGGEFIERGRSTVNCCCFEGFLLWGKAEEESYVT